VSIAGLEGPSGRRFQGLSRENQKTAIGKMVRGKTGCGRIMARLCRAVKNRAAYHEPERITGRKIMALPKAVLCLLGDEPADPTEEAVIRSTGFATFSITWKELDAVPNGWIQLLPPLDDPTVAAWAVAGRPGDFTASVRSKIALLTLGLERQAPPATAFVLTGEGEMGDLAGGRSARRGNVGRIHDRRDPG
jgi:hypothetical protein